MVSLHFDIFIIIFIIIIFSRTEAIEKISNLLVTLYYDNH